MGLVSFDVICSPDGWWLLSADPRPSAALDVLDVAPLPPLLALHLAACGGKLPQALPAHAAVTATGLLYADRDVIIPAMDWPEGVHDRNAAGTLIAEGGIICSARATGPTFEAAARAWSSALPPCAASPALRPEPARHHGAGDIFRAQTSP